MRRDVARFLCTNPGCRHVFSATEPAKGRHVICPKCGHGCDLRTQSKNPVRGGVMPVSPPTKAKGFVEPKPPRPVVLPAPLVPPPTPPPLTSMQTPTVVAPGIPERRAPMAPIAPMALPVAEKPKRPEPNEPTETLVHVHDYGARRGGSFGLIKGLIVFLLAVLFVGVAYIGYTVIEPTLREPVKNRVTGGATGGPANVPAGVGISFRNRDNKEERVLSANLDKEYWTDDRELRNQLRALAVGRHLEEKADSWFAIAAEDFGMQSPRQTEMLNGAVDRLKKHFGDTLQFTNKLEPAKILGEDAQMFPFRGRVTVNFEGECFLVSKQGIGYWILVAGTDGDIKTRIKERLEEEMALAVDRRGWHEQAPEMDTFVALKQAFAIKMPLGVWQQYEAVAEDGAGVLFLAAKAADGDPKKSANLLAVRLDKTADPKEALEVSRKWFKARAKAAAPSTASPWSTTTSRPNRSTWAALRAWRRSCVESGPATRSATGCWPASPPTMRRMRSASSVPGTGGPSGSPIFSRRSRRSRCRRPRQRRSQGRRPLWGRRRQRRNRHGGGRHRRRRRSADHLRADGEALLPQHVGARLERVGRHHLDRRERIGQVADVVNPERQQVLAEEIEARPFVPWRLDVLLHHLRRIAVLDEAELVDAVALERLVGRRRPDGDVMLVEDGGPERLRRDDETPLDAASREDGQHETTESA